MSKTIEVTLPDTIDITCKHKKSGTTLHGTFDTSTVSQTQLVAGMVAEARRGFAQTIVRSISSIERTRLARDGYKGNLVEILPGTAYVPEKPIEQRIDSMSDEQALAALALMQARVAQINEDVELADDVN